MVSVYGIQSEIASLQLKKLGKPSAYFPPQIINYLKSNKTSAPPKVSGKEDACWDGQHWLWDKLVHKQVLSGSSIA